MEDNLEDIFIRIKTKLDILQQVIDIFKDTPDKGVQQQIEQTKRELRQEINLLYSRGYSMIDLYAKLGGTLYKSQIISAQELLKDFQKKRDTQLVDLVNEDQELYRRAYMSRIRPTMYVEPGQQQQQQQIIQNEEMIVSEYGDLDDDNDSVMSGLSPQQVMRMQSNQSQQQRQRDVQMQESYEEFASRLRQHSPEYLSGLNRQNRIAQRNQMMESPIQSQQSLQSSEQLVQSPIFRNEEQLRIPIVELEEEKKSNKYSPDEVVMKEPSEQRGRSRGRQSNRQDEEMKEESDTTRSRTPTKDLSPEEQKRIGKEQDKFVKDIKSSMVDETIKNNILGVYDNYIRIKRGQLDASSNIYLSDLKTKNLINDLLKRNGQQQIPSIAKKTLEEKKNLFIQYLDLI